MSNRKTVMIEELTDRKSFNGLSSDLQKELAAKYCSGLEDKLKNAPGVTEAQKIIENICSNFDNECESEMIRLYLREFVYSTFHKIWKTKE